MIDYEDIDWEARQKLWDQYFETETDDWGREKKESPLRGVSICHRCGALVEDTWKHLEWHENLEPGDWER